MIPAKDIQNTISWHKSLRVSQTKAWQCHKSMLCLLWNQAGQCKDVCQPPQQWNKVSFCWPRLAGAGVGGGQRGISGQGGGQVVEQANQAAQNCTNYLGGANPSRPHCGCCGFPYNKGTSLPCLRLNHFEPQTQAGDWQAS